MKTALCSLAFLLILFTVAPGLCDDQQKAKKELDKITALSNDITGRRIINLSMAGMFNLKRLALVEERRKMGVNYGSLLLVHCLVNTGVELSEVAYKLKSKKTVLQMASEHEVDWSKVLTDAKKLNKVIDVNLLKHFAGDSQFEKLEKNEDYNVVHDVVLADGEVSRGDIDQAATRYLFLREHSPNYRGGVVAGTDRNAAGADPSRNRGGGGTGTRGGIRAPAAGGLPQ